MGRIDASLSEILGAICRLDREDRQRRRAIVATPISALLDEVAARATFTEAQRFAVDLERDPVREALCYAVRQLGKRLHELGGMDAMRAACDRQEDEPDGMRRVSVIDARWDGIGHWFA